MNQGQTYIVWHLTKVSRFCGWFQFFKGLETFGRMCTTMQQTRLTASHNKFAVHLHSWEVTQYLQAIWQVSNIYTMKSDLLQLHLVAAMVVASHITAYFEYESTHVYCLPSTNSWESVCPDLADSTLHDRPPSREIALLAIGEPWGQDPRGCHGTQKFQRWIMNRIRSFHWELLTILTITCSFFT